MRRDWYCDKCGKNGTTETLGFTDALRLAGKEHRAASPECEQFTEYIKMGQDATTALARLANTPQAEEEWIEGPNCPDL